MRYYILVFALVILTNPLFAQNEKSPLGVNISSPVAWQNDWQFVNIAHHSLAWFPADAELTWGSWFSADQLQADSYPYPGTDAVLCPIWDSPRSVSEDLVLTWDGTASVDVINHWSSPQLITSGTNRAEIRMDNDRFLFIKFSSTDESDPLRNIRLVKKSHETLDQTFSPEFLDLLSPFKVYRFMDYMQTNGSALVSRDDYSANDNLFYSQVPLSAMIDLANIQKADPWFCMPLTASDEFVVSFMNEICDNLEPDKTVYLELSNEVWNGMFDSHRQASDSARALSLTDSENNWEAAPIYYGYRSAQIHDLADSVIQSKSVNLRLKRVLAWQSVNTFFLENYIMPFYSQTSKVKKAPDAFAIAPYFGYALGSTETQNEISKWDKEKVIEQVMTGKYLDGQGTIEDAIASLEGYESLMEKYGVESLIAYEAGQHLVGHGGSENNDAMTTLFIETNRYEKMYDAYIKYLNEWKKSKAKLCVMFSSHGTYSKWGSWGLKEYISQSTSTAPKYRACLEFIENNPATWEAGDFTWDEVSVAEYSDFGYELMPNPVRDYVIIKAPQQSNIAIYNLLGVKLIEIKDVKAVETIINMDSFEKGVYILDINNTKERFTSKFIKIN